MSGCRGHEWGLCVGIGCDTCNPPLKPLPTDEIDRYRTHEWMGYEDDDRCAACLVLWSECDDYCPGEPHRYPCPTCGGNGCVGCGGTGEREAS